MRTRALLLLALATLGTAASAEPAPPIRVASKAFTEGVILGEVTAGLARSAGANVVHRRQLGGTRVVFDALQSGEIDAYAEYTGTLREEIFSGENLSGEAAIEGALRRRGLAMTRPLGFNNTYALGMRRDRARELGLHRISDLAARPDLRLGFTNEFMDRKDGWPSLRERYGLRHEGVRGLDHEVAYRALAANELDVTDLYSTDAQIREHDLQVLEDDLGHFPRYDAVIVYRMELEQTAPEVVAAWHRLEGALSEEDIIAANARAQLDHVSEAQVAADLLQAKLRVAVRVETASLLSRLWSHTVDHLALTLVSLAGAVAVGVPLGVLAARRRRLGHAVLAITGVIQTIPSLALLVLMIPLLGIGAAPAIAALFAYSLLPIVRGTHSGLTGISPTLREHAALLPLSSWARLMRLELPLASPALLSGIKTAAVINVGTATVGALVGAGGYGQPILAGLRLGDPALLLEGALPAGALALLVQFAFDGLERLIVPRGLRL